MTISIDNYLFGRAYKIEFFLTNEENDTEGKVLTLESSYKGENDLNITFDINYTAKASKGNSTKLCIYNLNNEQIEQLQTASETRVIISAGYEYVGNSKTKELTPVVYGDVIGMTTKREGNEKLSTFAISSGNKLRKEGKISQHFTGKTLNFIAESIANSFIESYIERVNNSNVTDTIPFDIKINLGKKGEEELEEFTATGQSSEVMDKFCKAYGLGWTILGSVVHVYLEDYAITKNPKKVFTVTNENIIGKIEREQDKVPSTVSPKSKKKILKFQTLFNPEITLDSMVVLGEDAGEEYEKLEGEYNVVGYRHDYSYRGVQSYTHVSVSEVDDEDEAKS